MLFWMVLAITENIEIGWTLYEPFIKLPTSKAVSYMDNRNDVVPEY
jgi:hypothetical protein